METKSEGTGVHMAGHRPGVQGAEELSALGDHNGYLRSICERGAVDRSGLQDQCGVRPDAAVALKKPKVLILAACRKPELLPYTELVFATIRVGFPTAQIIVYFNTLEPDVRAMMVERCKRLELEYCDTKTTHHEWISGRLILGQEPFVLCDTDVVFYESVEGWDFGDAPLAGFMIPEFEDSFSGCITRSRLHPSLMWVNPKEIRARLKKLWEGAEETVFTPRANLVHPQVQVLNQRRYFHDTCSLLYHAVGGTAFTDKQKDAYFHLYFGAHADIVLPRLPVDEAKSMALTRHAVLTNPMLGKGLWREQEDYFESRQPNYAGVVVPLGEATDRFGIKAIEWNKLICCGNEEAMAFNDLWYRYCHGIDDLIDTMRDGRPVMSKEQIISLFFNAAVLYNSNFYRKHSTLLFPIILQITNSYADSVAWERSPIAHRRAMADVMRMAGNEMYNMVALICGGESHMRAYSPQIKEGDWVGQHED